MKLPGMAGSMLLGKSRSGLRTGSMVPFAAQQAMNMSTGERRGAEHKGYGAALRALA